MHNGQTGWAGRGARRSRAFAGAAVRCNAGGDTAAASSTASTAAAAPAQFSSSSASSNGSIIGQAVQVEPTKSKLKAPGTKRLKLEFENMLSGFAFN